MSGMQVGWLVVAVVSLLTGLAVVAAPESMGIPGAPPALEIPGGQPHRWARQTPASQNGPRPGSPTVVRVRPAELAETGKIGKNELSRSASADRGPLGGSPGAAESRGNISPSQVGASPEHEPRVVWETPVASGGSSGSPGRRLLHALFPFPPYSSPPRRETTANLPPPVSLPEDLENQWR